MLYFLELFYNSWISWGFFFFTFQFRKFLLTLFKLTDSFLNHVQFIDDPWEVFFLLWHEGYRGLALGNFPSATLDKALMKSFPLLCWFCYGDTLCLFQNEYFFHLLVRSRRLFSWLFTLRTWWGSWGQNSKKNIRGGEIPKTVASQELLAFTLNSTFSSSSKLLKCFYQFMALAVSAPSTSQLWFPAFACLSRFWGAGFLCHLSFPICPR